MVNEGNSSNAVPQLVITGDGGVGKTSLVVRYTSNKFEEGYIPTLADHFDLDVKMDDGTHYKFDLEDTAGQDDFATLRDQFLESGDIFIIVYSVDSPASLRKADNLLGSISDLKNGKSFKFILVGNKIDIQNKSVAYDDAKFVADKYGGDLIECSAQANINVEECFRRIAKKWYEEDQESTDANCTICRI